MANEIFVVLPDDPSGPLEVLRDRGGSYEAVGLPYRAGRANTVIAFAPATRIAHFCQALAARNETEAQRAAPFAIEDDLAQPVEDIHVALGARQKGGAVRDIYTADRGLMGAWIARLEEAGLAEAEIIPEQSLAGDLTGAMAFPSHTLLRRGNRIVGLDAGLPPSLHDALLESDGKSPQLVTDRMGWLVSRYREHGGVDLRTGGYGVKRRSEAGWRAWALTGALACAIGVLWTGMQLVETHQQRADAGTFRQQSAAHYAAIFPGTPLPRDLDAASRQILATHAAQSRFDFIRASEALYQALAQTPGTYLTALRYDGRAGTLQAGLSLETADGAASLVSAMEQQGYAVLAVDDLVGGEAGYTGQIIIGARP